MNKKGQTSTDTPIILSILVFQAFIIIMLGFLNVDSNNNDVSVPLFSFDNIITSISELGWFNTIIFAPLIICLGYILAKLIRGGG